LGGGLGQHLRGVVHARDVRVGPARAEQARDVAGAGAEIVDDAGRGEGDAIEGIERGSQPVPGELQILRGVPGPRPLSDHAEVTASRTAAGCLAASATRAQCLRTVPSGPTHTVERMTPFVFLPYIILSP